MPLPRSTWPPHFFELPSNLFSFIYSNSCPTSCRTFDLMLWCRLEEKSDRDRKIALRDLFQNARNRLIKLLVLVKWSAHVPAVKASWVRAALLSRLASFSWRCTYTLFAALHLSTAERPLLLAARLTRLHPLL